MMGFIKWQPPQEGCPIAVAQYRDKRPRIRNWKHAALILLSVPMVLMIVIGGILFLPAFWGLRYLAKIEYDG